MRTLLALAGPLCGIMLVSPASAESVQASPKANVDFGENLFAAFSNICLTNRGSWSASSKAAEGSGLNFRRSETKRTQEIEFSDFPLEVVLKRWGKSGYICLAQSLVENSPTPESLADRLKNGGPGLSDVSFVSVKRGMDGTLPKKAKAKGRQSPDVMIRVGPSILKDASTVQLLIFSADLEPQKNSIG